MYLTDYIWLSFNIKKKKVPQKNNNRFYQISSLNEYLGLVIDKKRKKVNLIVLFSYSVL
jgi:hypothetical protein